MFFVSHFLNYMMAWHNNSKAFLRSCDHDTKNTLSVIVFERIDFFVHFDFVCRNH